MGLIEPNCNLIINRSILYYLLIFILINTGCKERNPEPILPKINSTLSTNTDSTFSKNINIKDSLEKWIDSEHSAFKLYDKASFLSYFPDSLNKVNDINWQLKVLNEFKKHLPQLVQSYSKYYHYINDSSKSSSVIRTAYEFLETKWTYTPNYIIPKYCLKQDTINSCWKIPSDFINQNNPRIYSGMPYCWGGKMVFDSFRLFVEKSLFAPGDACGKTCCRFKNCVCLHNTAGIDCSGFIIKSFKLSEDLRADAVYGTNDLFKTERFDLIGDNIQDLKKGDILLKKGDHVGLCIEVDHKLKYCKVIHSGKSCFFGKNGYKLKGLDQGVRLDSANFEQLQLKINEGYLIKRFAIYKHTYRTLLDLIKYTIDGVN